MKIKEVKVGIIKDSRKKDTIIISINNCWTAAPSGKSTGKHEVPSYKNTIRQDFGQLKKLIEISQFDFKNFDDLIVVEKLLKNKVGGNTLFVLEASILKAIAKEKGKELYEFLGSSRKIPKLLSNTIGGGVHTNAKKKPDFQEFLIIGDKKTNTLAYNELSKILNTKKRNDEGALMTNLCNKHTVELMSWGDIDIGTDVAASSFYKNGKYHYKNPKKSLIRKQQIDFIVNLINDYNLKYVEDPLQEEDFKGFAEILKRTKGKCLVVGDDLTTTNLERTKKAIKLKAINGIIIKPNQIGSLLEVKKVIDLCKKHNIKIIISHRSGETEDYTIADLAVARKADMIKIPVVGKERLAKVNRLDNIKKRN